MAQRGTTYIGIGTCLGIIILYLIPIAYSDDRTPIPSSKYQVESWFHQNVKPVADRKGTLDPALEAAEVATWRIINMKSDGSGDFRTIFAAIESIPLWNKRRVVIYLGGGVYREKVKVDRYRPFVTFYGNPRDMPVLEFHGTAREYGTVDSATLIVEADYFNGVNLKIVNSAPRPNGGVGQQALALRIGGDKSSFYNCKLIGFQDTLCDDKGRHFFKDCYIEGTVDFIFGSGKSIYLNTELHVITGDGMTMITAQAGGTRDEDEGFSMVHCRVTGTPGANTALGRAWMAYPKVTFSYCELGAVVGKEGWSNNRDPANNRTVIFGEYKNYGPGANPAGRAKFVKQLSDWEAIHFISLGYISGSSWLLPPAVL